MSRNFRPYIQSHYSLESLEHYGCADRDDVADALGEMEERLESVEVALKALGDPETLAKLILESLDRELQKFKEKPEDEQ